MSVLLSVDPGIRGSGAAVFKDGLLVKAAYLVNPASKGNGPGECATMGRAIVDWAGHTPTEAALEWPRIYASRIREGVTRADPNDLLALAGVGASVASFFALEDVTAYAPSDWKSQLKKDVCEARVRNRLSSLEMGVLTTVKREYKSKAHNAIDAIGIGLFHLGRFERKRVIL